MLLSCKFLRHFRRLQVLIFGSLYQRLIVLRHSFSLRDSTLRFSYLLSNNTLFVHSSMKYYNVIMQRASISTKLLQYNMDRPCGTVFLDIANTFNRSKWFNSRRSPKLILIINGIFNNLYAKEKVS